MYKNLVIQLRAYVNAIEATTEKERAIQNLKDLANLATVHRRLLQRGVK